MAGRIRAAGRSHHDRCLCPDDRHRMHSACGKRRRTEEQRSSNHRHSCLHVSCRNTSETILGIWYRRWYLVLRDGAHGRRFLHRSRTGRWRYGGWSQSGSDWRALPTDRRPVSFFVRCLRARGHGGAAARPVGAHVAAESVLCYWTIAPSAARPGCCRGAGSVRSTPVRADVSARCGVGSTLTPRAGASPVCCRRQGSCLHHACGGRHAASPILAPPHGRSTMPRRISPVPSVPHGSPEGIVTHADSRA